MAGRDAGRRLGQAVTAAQQHGGAIVNISSLAGLIGLDFDWSITDRLKLTQDTNAVAETGGSAIAIIDSRNTTLDLITGLDATINSSLTARFSYAVEYDSNPPPGAVQTDTLSRVTLIYDF